LLLVCDAFDENQDELDNKGCDVSGADLRLDSRGQQEHINRRCDQEEKNALSERNEDQVKDVKRKLRDLAPDDRPCKESA